MQTPRLDPGKDQDQNQTKTKGKRTTPKSELEELRNAKALLAASVRLRDPVIENHPRDQGNRKTGKQGNRETGSQER